METEEIIHTRILSLRMEQWDKILEIEHVGLIHISPKGLYELIGTQDGMFLTAIASKMEMKFIRKFYEYSRKMHSEENETNLS